MRKLKITIACLMIAFHSANAVDQIEPTKSSPTTIQNDMSFEALLDDARQSGVGDEIIEIKPVSTGEFWLRKIGGGLLLKIFAAKACIKNWWSS